MSDLLLLTTQALCALYLLLIIAFSIGLLRKPIPNDMQPHSVSVIVPARNEAHNIDACLQALSQQTYPVDHFEIIVVDDRSTDDTAHQVNKWTHNLPNLKTVSVSEQTYECPKKNALWQGIKNTHAEMIITTDADCRPDPEWISSTVAQFAPNVGMVTGHAPLAPNANRFSGLLSLQALIVSILAAASTGLGWPLTCTGRNLAFRRKAFDDVEGYKNIGHIIGGDDVLLMRQIVQKSDWKIRFNPADNSSTISQSHPDNLFHRQVRYQSKTIHYGIPTLILATAVYIFHAILIALPLFYWLVPSVFFFIVLCLGIKIIADAMLLFFGAARFKSIKLLAWFPILELILIPYIVVICALGVFSPFKWK